MGTRGERATLQSLSDQLKEVLANQVTKSYFDDKVKKLEDRMTKQEEDLGGLNQRVQKIEEDQEDLPVEIYSELHEQESRKRNVIVFGLEEESGRNKIERYEKERRKMNELLKAMNDIDLVAEGDISMRLLRLGKIDTNRTTPRPLRITFANTIIRDRVLACCKNLKGKDEWVGVSIVPDLTKVQQKLSNAKRAELQKEADKRNRERDREDTNKFEFKVMGNYGFGNLRVGKKILNPEETDN